MASHYEYKPTTLRPLAVWLALGILVFYIPFLVLMNLLPSESVLDNVDWTDDPIGMVELAAVMISLAVAIWALAVRKLWSRWFVAASLAYMIGTLLWGHFLLDGDPDDKLNILMGAAVGLSPLVIVILLVSFGEGTKNYFAKRP